MSRPSPALPSPLAALSASIRRVVLVLLCLAAVACGSGNSERNGEGDSKNPPPAGPPELIEIPEAPEEVVESAVAELDERQLRAAFVGDDLEVRVPLHRKGKGELGGDIEIALMNASTAMPVEIGKRRIAFEQSEADEVHTVTIRDLPMQWVRGQTATLVLDWMVDTDGDAETLVGKRSLYAALGPLEVQLRGPTQLNQGEGSPVRVLVLNRETQSPIEEAVVRATLNPTEEDETPLELFEGLSNEFGELVEQLALPDDVFNGQVRIEVLHEEGQVWTAMNVTVNTSEKRLHLSSDKTIYKPGQDIELRVLALDGPEHEPLVDEEAVFEAYDGKRLKVFKRSVKTDEFGAASVTVPTDVRVNEGTWTLSVALAGSTQSLSLPVRRYILPKMQVDVLPDAPYVLVGEALTGRIEARYSFGEPVANADVLVTPSLPGSAPISGKTDEGGAFAFEFPTPEQLGQDASITLTAQVTDTAGQQQLGTAASMIAKAPVVVSVFPEHEPVAVGIDNRLLVLVSDPLGRPIVSDVTLQGVTADALQLTTNSTGIAAVEFEPQGAMNLRVQAEDGAGRIGKTQLVLGATDAPAFSIRPDRALYARGDEATLFIYGADDMDRAHVDLFRGVAGVASVDVELKNGKGQVNLPIAGAMGGLLTAEVQARNDAGQLLLASTRLLIESDQRLKVNLLPSSDSVLPGEEVELAVEVTDAEGNPQVASIGLNVVNESSFALGGEPKATLESSFALEGVSLPPQVNVLGVTGQDVLNMAPSNERDLLARALFSKAALNEAMTGAGATSSFRFDFDSYATELPLVRNSMQVKVQADANYVVQTLRPGFDGTKFDADEWFEAVETMANRLRDPFGQKYQVMLNSSSQLLTLTSFGPDELEGTDDDATAQVVAFLPSPPRTPGATGPTGAGVAINPAGGFAENQGATGDFALDAPPMAAAGPVAATGAPVIGPSGPTAPSEPQGVSVRSDFRETVYSNPTLITDADGRASVRFGVAHSINIWRASAEGSAPDGKLGSGRASFRTFQSFFVDFDMPTNLTQGDQLELPVIVYNYLNEETEVEVTLDAGTWLEVTGESTQRVSLGPSEVRSVKFQVNVARAGTQTVTLLGSAGDTSDALRRAVNVEPDGTPDDATASGTLGQDGVVHTLDIPEDAIEGGTSLYLTLTPGFAADAAKGVDSMLREPNGCFEQTTSTAWPNTIVARLLEQTGQLTGEKREETLALITRGYQRLLTFESPTGGYNWWGDSDPGNRILSAIMLWHLKDLESLIEIDTAVRDRTLNWLLAQQASDGSWESGDALHAGNEVLGTSTVRTTAFISWALAHTGWAPEAVGRASSWLAGSSAEDDVYAAALVGNALSFGAPDQATTKDALDALDALGESIDDGQIVWRSTAPSWTGNSGNPATIELTSLVAYGLLHDGGYAGSTDGAVRHIVASKDSLGTWYNTQTTMNALRALSASVQPDGVDASGTLTVTVNGAEAAVFDVDPTQKDVFKTVDLSEFAVTGDNQVDLAFDGEGEVNYQVTRRVYLPTMTEPEGPLSLDVTYDTQQTTLGSPIQVQAVARNNDAEGSRDQVMVRVGRAPGFAPDQQDLQNLVNSRMISRYEVGADDVTLYLMGLAAGEARALTFRMTPSLALDARAPASVIYAYYQPDLQQKLPSERFVVTAQ